MIVSNRGSLRSGCRTLRLETLWRNRRGRSVWSGRDQFPKDDQNYCLKTTGEK